MQTKAAHHGNTCRHVEARRATGFTLIELLVVIGIIVLLIAILVPALSGARQSGYKTQTAALLQGLRSNIEEYAAQFGGQFPGPLPESQVAGTNNKVSGTQNMFLGLTFAMSSTAITGGKQIPGGGTQPYVDPTKTNGPADLSNVVQVGATTAPRQYNPFYTPASREVSAATSGTTWPPGGVTMTPASSSWAFPTVLDRFPDQLPVLYFRRNAGIETPVLAELAWPTGTAATHAYYRTACSEYLDATSIKAPSGTDLVQGGKAAFHSSNNTPAKAYLTALETTMKGASGNAYGGFVLIAAGPSRLYGGKAGATTDSIVVVGGQ